ncbi:hypothetical protein BD780_002960 [Clostridium tetanomorphum]|nr:hypothetical protein [Clostridium tetanomorphum]NRS85735.1 hypothetical protein [Clostridium tetanomorphum]NRZ96256.1 hypothetical protein [Clostridium tetanomorphum]SQC02539.1 Uncharacterised protein [Clostridium tetanomorphum]
MTLFALAIASSIVIMIFAYNKNNCTKKIQNVIKIHFKLYSTLQSPRR